MAFRFITPPADIISSSEDPPALSIRRQAVGSTSESFVRSYTHSATPAIWSHHSGTLYRQDIQLRKTHYNFWDIEVPYAKRKNETGQWTWDFDTTGGSVHITNSKATISKWAAEGVDQADIPEHKGAIGVEGEEVKGTDITIPVMRFNVQYKHPLGAVTIPFAKMIHNLTGKVNSGPMLGFAAGEVLFLGGRGSDGSDAEATVNYSFAMSPNTDSLTIGEIAEIVKKGWEVAWVAYKDDVDAGRAVKRPQFVYVEKVYDTTDLAAALGFGA